MKLLLFFKQVVATKFDEFLTKILHGTNFKNRCWLKNKSNVKKEISIEERNEAESGILSYMHKKF